MKRNPAEIAAYILRDVNDGQLVIGPVIRRHVTVAGHDRKRFWSLQIELDDNDRAMFVMAIVAQARRGLVLHTTEDERTTAELCRKLWPAERPR